MGRAMFHQSGAQCMHWPGTLGKTSGKTQLPGQQPSAWNGTGGRRPFLTSWKKLSIAPAPWHKPELTLAGSIPQYASGQQCCYDSTGTQILTRDSIGGSTPDRGHDWGSPPFKKPPRVPGFSHWLYDVISFYYCCLWSDNCQFYLKHRPSSDCRTYKPPRVASAFGDPHFLTFDGANITFKGQGEYTLLESNLTTLRVQGRTQPARPLNKTLAKVTGLSSVAIQENNSDVIEVRNSEHSGMLEVLLNKEVLSFSEQSWMDLKGLFLYSTADQNITVMFSSGAGMELRGRGGFLSLTVLLPVEFHNHTQGLLGVMNDNPTDEYTFKNGTTMSSDASPQQLFEFGADWAVKYETSLFTYDTQFLLNNFYAEKHNSAFIPVFSPYEDPADLLMKEMTLLCDSDPFCRFDVLTTRSLKVGNSTRISHQNHKWLVESLQPVVSCGWLDHPTNGKKEGTNYLLDSTIRFSCNQGYRLAGSEERTCQLTGVWSGSTTSCLPGTDNNQAVLFSCIFGILGFVILVVLIFLLCRKQKRQNNWNQKLNQNPGISATSEQELVQLQRIGSL